jgi:2-methylcitrate dehydratase PrpD
MDLAFQFADNACQKSYADLPAPVVVKTREFILDTVGAAIAGSSAEGIGAGLQLIREAGGTPQATVMVYGDRLPATSVAMINGAMCQARDFDPVYEPGVLLPYGPILAAALAAAELCAASGKELINAVALGTDLTCRIGKALVSGLGWSRTATLGVFGAALASARLLRLDREQTVSALGLALSQSSGNIQTVIDGSLAKRYQGGFTAEAGLKAALLASRGVTGPSNVFEGRCGFFKLYEADRFRRDVVVDGLGEHYEGAEASVKPYPCAREHHGALAAALRLFAAGVRAADVQSVVVHLPPNAFALSGKPFRRTENHSIGSAIGSAAYGVAVALVNGKVTLDDFQNEAIAHAAVRELADRIEVQEDKSISDAKSLVPQSVVVQMRDAGKREALSKAMPGSPQMPLSPGELKEKFQACLSHSARPLARGRAEAIASSIENLANLNSIADLKGFA